MDLYPTEIYLHRFVLSRQRPKENQLFTQQYKILLFVLNSSGIDYTIFLIVQRNRAKDIGKREVEKRDRTGKKEQERGNEKDR